MHVMKKTCANTEYHYEFLENIFFCKEKTILLLETR